ncbi:lysophospholipase [Novosphingobium endophyticum]|uniref:Lysophospholipase n=2 Tax=Novosphingobium endophyticum TaxID=1955250 RepID=A0A916TRG3_9SPHN|nr:lysophospholipase [Novosphingobium endophyticum]
MHRIMLFLASLALPFGASAQTSPPAPTDAPRPIAPSKIILVGDSTTAVNSGWGPSFCAYHVTSFMACLNLARGGRSSSSYRAEGSWAVALSEMKAPGYRNVWVLIQLGHNDQPGKPGRSTDLATEFPANLARYVDEARAVGARPVLLTPLTRRMFQNGVLQNDLERWAAAVRKVAAGKNVPLIDLNARSAAAVQAMGEADADRFAQLPPGSAPVGPQPNSRATEVQEQPMAQPKLSFDRTHLGREGADYFASMVTDELARAVPDMRPLLVP